MLTAAVIAAFIMQCGARNLMQAPTMSDGGMMGGAPTMAGTSMEDTSAPMTDMMMMAPAPAPMGVPCNTTMDCLNMGDLGEFVFCNPDVMQCNACGDIGDVCCPFEDTTTGEMLVDCRDGAICIDGMCESVEEAGAPGPAPAQMEMPSPVPTVLAPVYGASFTGGYGSDQ